MRLWNTVTGQLHHTLTRHEGEVTGVAFAPDGLCLASSSWDQTVRLWSPATGRALSVLGFSSLPQSQGDELRAVGDGAAPSTTHDATPATQLLATGGGDHCARIWNATTGDHLNTLEGHEGDVNAVAFSPDGRMLASAGADKTVRVWDVRSGREMGVLRGHDGEVTGLAFSPDGQILASASWDSTIKLWEPRAGRECGRLSGHKGAITSAAFSPDGQLVASGSGTSSSSFGTWPRARSRV